MILQGNNLSKVYSFYDCFALCGTDTITDIIEKKTFIMNKLADLNKLIAIIPQMKPLVIINVNVTEADCFTHLLS